MGSRHRHALDALAHDRSHTDRQVIGHYLILARRRQADLDHRAVTPGQLLDLLRRGDARLVRDDAALLQVVVRQLELLQDDIYYKTAFRDLWNEPRQEEPTPRARTTNPTGSAGGGSPSGSTAG
jgi:hypothetical protein